MCTRCRFLSLFLLAGIVPSTMSASADELVHSRDDRATLALLATAQEEHRSKIASFSLTMTEKLIFTAPNRSGDQERYERTTIHRERTRGASSWIDREEATKVEGKDGERTEAKGERMVITDKYAAYWRIGNPIAYVYDYDSLDTRSKETRAVVRTTNPRSVLRYGFGDGDMSLREICEVLLPDGFTPTVEEDRNENGAIETFRIGLYEGPALVSELTVDPMRGHMITSVRLSDSGVIFREVDTQLDEAQPGIWFPMRWEERQYGNESDEATPRRPQTVSVNEVTSLEINPSIEDEDLTWRALGLPSDISIVRKDVRGKVTRMVVENNELVPEGIAERLQGSAPIER